MISLLKRQGVSITGYVELDKNTDIKGIHSVLHVEEVDRISKAAIMPDNVNRR